MRTDCTRGGRGSLFQKLFAGCIVVPASAATSTTTVPSKGVGTVPREEHVRLRTTWCLLCQRLAISLLRAAVQKTHRGLMRLFQGVRSHLPKLSGSLSRDLERRRGGERRRGERDLQRKRAAFSDSSREEKNGAKIVCLDRPLSRPLERERDRAIV